MNLKTQFLWKMAVLKLICRIHRIRNSNILTVFAGEEWGNLTNWFQNVQEMQEAKNNYENNVTGKVIAPVLRLLLL